MVAEWKKVNGEMCLHVHCFVSGPNLLLELAAEFRYQIFSKELPLVSQSSLASNFMHTICHFLIKWPLLEHKFLNKATLIEWRVCMNCSLNDEYQNNNLS